MRLGERVWTWMVSFRTALERERSVPSLQMGVTKDLGQ